MRPFSLLIKPAGADCNLRCEYCFYLCKRALYPSTRSQRMTDETLETLIRSYMATPQPVYSFGWQGGEPLLLGTDFFRRVTELQKRHGKPGTVVANSLQTNATLITEELAEHLAEYRFLVGCSLDGPPQVHDRYRRTSDGKPTHAAVLRGIETLRRHRVEFNILVLVSQANVAHPRAVYDDLIERDYCYHQYIPCVEFDAQGHLRPFSINGTEWGAFLCGLFDAWYPQHVRRVSIRLFDDVLTRLVEGRPAICHMQRDCCQYFVVEHNGDIYPCDFFVEPDLRIGNVKEMSWASALTSPVYVAFGRRKAHWNPACQVCAYLPFCAGDCLKHRGVSARPSTSLSELCTGYRRFFHYTLDRFRLLAQEILAGRHAVERALAHLPPVR